MNQNLERAKSKDKYLSTKGKWVKTFQRRWRYHKKFFKIPWKDNRVIITSLQLCLLIGVPASSSLLQASEKVDINDSSSL